MEKSTKFKVLREIKLKYLDYVSTCVDGAKMVASLENSLLLRFKKFGRRYSVPTVMVSDFGN